MTTDAHPVALITGGTRGIGWGIARCLWQAGYNLVLTGQRPAEEVTPSFQSLLAQAPAGRQIWYERSDIASGADRTQLLANLRQRVGRLDVLVNNAGVAPKVRADLLDAGEESFDRLITTNLKGPYFLTQGVARWMVEQKQARSGYRGVIIFVSSVSAVVASINRGDYCLSKAGVAMAARLWAARLAEFGIDVYEIRPGIIETDMTAGVKEKYDHLIAQGLTMEKRWGTPQDIGKAVTMLARGDLPYATGQVLHIDGGLTQPRL